MEISDFKNRFLPHFELPGLFEDVLDTYLNHTQEKYISVEK